jgi:hypothetical protein
VLPTGQSGNSSAKDPLRDAPTGTRHACDNVFSCKIICLNFSFTVPKKAAPVWGAIPHCQNTTVHYTPLNTLPASLLKKNNLLTFLILENQEKYRKSSRKLFLNDIPILENQERYRKPSRKLFLNDIPHFRESGKIQQIFQKTVLERYSPF